nr:hypothetical protein [Marinicella sp. W31]MDC2878867.1 hypothetical protein [Marinicella sp. W31]
MVSWLPSAVDFLLRLREGQRQQVFAQPGRVIVDHRVELVMRQTGTARKIRFSRSSVRLIRRARFSEMNGMTFGARRMLDGGVDLLFAGNRLVAWSLIR